ncbi:outer membrane beta-barrel protein [Niabella beijingensis]|uniref:outer membrane beta-barrel protein n=1 Tax=Niabella beijingensis TaxID=2872700 RepID=UPI001CBB09B8|nr:outer membrane beta-barrel protein [Niabella beijingensis]
MNDEELDQLFRDAASRFQPPDAPEGAWEAFYRTKMLPAEKNTRQRRFFIPWRYMQLAAAVLLLIATGLVFFLKQAPLAGLGGISSNDREPSGILKSETSPPVEEGGLPPAFMPGGTADNYPAKGGAPDLAAMIPQKNLYPVISSGPPAFNIPEKGAKTQQHADTAAARKPFFSLRDKPAGERPAQPALPGFYDPSPSTETSRGRTATTRWQVGLLAGSNLGMVRGTVSSKPGLNAGVLVQRKLGQSRFSLESGVVYESMTYDVNNADFNPNGNPVSSRVSNIEGACTMVDVPVNVRYDVVASKKNKAFISTGVSPTVIVKQSYIYDLDQGDGPVQINRDVSGRGKSVYAVANLSIGYEQKWNHVSVQIAPYVKIPMGEIGYGNLSLGGVGTQISIKKDL